MIIEQVYARARDRFSADRKAQWVRYGRRLRPGLLLTQNGVDLLLRETRALHLSVLLRAGF